MKTQEILGPSVREYDGSFLSRTFRSLRRVAPSLLRRLVLSTDYAQYASVTELFDGDRW
jgi:hypothetical protein